MPLGCRVSKNRVEAVLCDVFLSTVCRQVVGVVISAEILLCLNGILTTGFDEMIYRQVVAVNIASSAMIHHNLTLSVDPLAIIDSKPPFRSHR